MQRKIISRQGGKSLANCKHNEHAVIESFAREIRGRRNQCALHLWENHPPQTKKILPFQRTLPREGFSFHETGRESGVKRAAGEKTFSFLCENFAVALNVTKKKKQQKIGYKCDTRQQCCQPAPGKTIGVKITKITTRATGGKSPGRGVGAGVKLTVGSASQPHTLTHKLGHEEDESACPEEHNLDGYHPTSPIKGDGDGCQAI